nr:DUF3394 domain-containing protein [Melaminivora jejuensis]
MRADRPSAHWFYLPAIALVLLVWWSQGRRRRPGVLAPSAPAGMAG